MPKPRQRQPCGQARKRQGPAKELPLTKGSVQTFAAGNCKFGAQCKFSHAPPPKTSAKRWCEEDGKGQRQRRKRGKEEGGKNQGGVAALPLIPLLTPMTAFGLLDGAGAPQRMVVVLYPPPEAKPEKAKERLRQKTRPAKSYWQQGLSSLARPSREVRSSIGNVSFRRNAARERDSSRARCPYRPSSLVSAQEILFRVHWRHGRWSTSMEQEGPSGTRRPGACRESVLAPL